mmetsp:Transcript_8239/g.17665  ORF Transcript_8239/g.17665 Transcript_8239/m.17665 type:complete len:267 (+) Transcript_8239:410-1210(+)
MKNQQRHLNLAPLRLHDIKCLIKLNTRPRHQFPRRTQWIINIILHRTFIPRQILGIHGIHDPRFGCDLINHGTEYLLDFHFKRHIHSHGRSSKNNSRNFRLNACRCHSGNQPSHGLTHENDRGAFPCSLLTLLLHIILHFQLRKLHEIVDEMIEFLGISPRFAIAPSMPVMIHRVDIHSFLGRGLVQSQIAGAEAMLGDSVSEEQHGLGGGGGVFSWEVGGEDGLVAGVGKGGGGVGFGEVGWPGEGAGCFFGGHYFVIVGFGESE